ncbi:Gas vesicle synthesis protein GvpO [Bacillus sp. THAF10]|uniref:gas vesicle protein GvpO n=1 Tax=Bacillus sp. THAF10 TaxID=2587848 RepID=UPI0012A8CA81|nr:gas vesicle protein GvpO [Bacillus sp. THAF10]QFT90425.1 Gas vesicle synthesis protein GvpO [Bacillus sp. THAF10]
MKKVLKEVTEFFTEYVKPPYKITGVQPTEQGWDVEVEVIEEKEYMKAYAKDQMIGVYHAKINKEMELESYTRKSLRSRSSIDCNNE